MARYHLQLNFDANAPYSKRIPNARVVTYEWQHQPSQLPIKVAVGDEIYIQLIPLAPLTFDEPTLKVYFIQLPDGSPYSPFCEDVTLKLSNGVKKKGSAPMFGAYKIEHQGTEYKFVLEIDTILDNKWFCDPQMNVDPPGGGGELEPQNVR